VSTLTGPAPLPPLLTTPVVATAEGTPVVLNILAARAADQLNSPLVETLQDAAGPGNVITGTVEESAPDGTMTVTAQNGTSITVHHPPELPLEPGSAVVLRIIPTASAPQAMLLAVNGRPVFGRTTSAAAPAAASASASASASTAAASTARALPAPPALGSASVAASYIATISLEDEVAIETALSDDGLALTGASGNATAEPIGPSVVATLIRPAPAKLGQTPVPSGTRYLVTLREIGLADGAPSTPATRPLPATTPAAGSAPAASTTPALPGAAPVIAARPAAASVAALPEVTISAAALPEVPVSAAATVLLALQEAMQTPAPIPLPVLAPAAALLSPPMAETVAAALPAPAATTMVPPIALPDPPVEAAPALPVPTEAEIQPTPTAALLGLPPPAPTAADPNDQPVPAPAITAPSAETPPSGPIPQIAAATAVPTPSAVTQPATGIQNAVASPPINDAAAFQAQVLTLAGRVTAPRAPAETLVETAIGTLALPLPAPLPLGVAVQLRVSAVAPPQAAPHAGAAHGAPEPNEPVPDTAPPSLIEELVRALAPAGAGPISEIHQMLALQPGDGLAAAIISFLTGMRPSTPQRNADIPSRKALLDAGRKDLVDRLDRAGTEIGTTRPPHGPDGWTVTILPFLGQASVRPMRLYRKRHEDKDAGGKSKGKPSERFMLEVELKRMGPLQFDGLIRERRFDLVVRSRDPFAPPLQKLVEQVFQDGLLLTGWSGEIGFSRIGTFPMVPDPESSAHLDLGA
jgi:hypothetical protein